MVQEVDMVYYNVVSQHSPGENEENKMKKAGPLDKNRTQGSQIQGGSADHSTTSFSQKTCISLQSYFLFQGHIGMTPNVMEYV
jgi:hypothetical protein